MVPIRFLVGILFLFASVFYAANSTAVPFSSAATVNTLTSIQLTHFSIDPTAVNAGDSVGFTTALTNLGNTLVTMQTQVYIYRGSDLAGILTYSNTTIIGGETQTLIRSWNSAGRDPGSYMAFVNVTSAGNFTNTLNLTFVITAAPPVSPAPTALPLVPSSGGGPVSVSSRPPSIQIPAVFSPETTGGRLLRFSLYQEAVPGSNMLIYPLVENPSSREMRFNVQASGLAASLAQSVDEARLLPGEQKSISVPIEIPNTLVSGYYPMDIHLRTDGVNLSYPFILRVPDYPSPSTRPVVFREVTISPERNSSIVTLTLKNPGSKSFSHVQVQEQLPPGLSVDMNAILFTTSPAEILSAQRLIRWDFENLGPSESRTIIYEIPRISPDASEYTLWFIYQLTAIENTPSDPISLTGFEAPSVFAGERRDVVLSFFNAGALPQNVAATLVAPSNWSVSPSAFSFLLAARNPDSKTISIQPASNVPPGTYTLRLRLDYGSVSQERLLFVTVNPPLTEISPPLPLRYQLLAWVQRNAGNILVAFAALVIAGFIIYPWIGRFLPFRLR